MTGRFDWMADAECAQVDADLWTAVQAGGNYDDARRICGQCPVRPQCAAYAGGLRNQHDIALHGMWAGQTPQQQTTHPDTERAAA
jgi:WhiB family redox-sensing transcriptional regulator